MYNTMFVIVVIIKRRGLEQDINTAAIATMRGGLFQRRDRTGVAEGESSSSSKFI